MTNSSYNRKKVVEIIKNGVKKFALNVVKDYTNWAGTKLERSNKVEALPRLGNPAARWQSLQRAEASSSCAGRTLCLLVLPFAYFSLLPLSPSLL
jgi:hypothetical protein